MHRSRLRNKLVEGRTKVTNRVSERAKSLIPVEVDAGTDKCMMCKRKMRAHRRGAGDGRICSPACAQAWAAS